MNSKRQLSRKSKTESSIMMMVSTPFAPNLKELPMVLSRRRRLESQMKNRLWQISTENASKCIQTLKMRRLLESSDSKTWTICSHKTPI